MGPARLHVKAAPCETGRKPRGYSQKRSHRATRKSADPRLKPLRFFNKIREIWHDAGCSTEANLIGTRDGELAASVGGIGRPKERPLPIGNTTSYPRAYCFNSQLHAR